MAALFVPNRASTKRFALCKMQTVASTGAVPDTVEPLTQLTIAADSFQQRSTFCVDQSDSVLQKDILHALLWCIIWGMNQSHQKQKMNAEKLDLLSDEVALRIQHQSGMPLS